MAAAHESLRNDNRLTAFTAAGMYGSAAFVSFVEGFVPGGPTPTITPGLSALVLVALILVTGPRMPRRALALLGPLGVALIAVALATSPGAGDGAVLYMWPVIWMSYFFGRRGAIAIVGSVAVAHVCVLLALPAADGYADRWVDVTVSVAIVAAVVQTLAHRNDRLLDLVAEEARTDALTGLLNRRGFDERAAVELAHSRREHACIAIACFDIDYFKQINDEWGHEVGDRVLERIGAVLSACAREVDAVARVGGEEFIVLLPGATVADAAGFADRIHKAIARPHEGLPSIRVSAGVAASLAPDGIEPLLQQADRALYAAKSGGRNRTNVFTEIALSA